jgi:hypothetical protein
MISTISIVNPSDVLAPPLTFINVTTSCDQGPSKRVLHDFAYRELLLWVSSKIPTRETLKYFIPDQWLRSLDDPMAHIISWLHISQVPSMSCVETPNSWNSEMLHIRSTVEIYRWSDGLDHFVTSHIASSYNSYLWLLQLDSQRNVDLLPRVLYIQRFRSYRDFAYRKFLQLSPLTSPAHESVKCWCLAMFPLDPTT